MGRGFAGDEQPTPSRRVDRRDLAGGVYWVRPVAESAGEQPSFEVYGPDRAEELLSVEPFEHSPSDSEIIDLAIDAGALEGVTCKFCDRAVPVVTAHLHQGEWVGDECCWDERLSVSA